MEGHAATVEAMQLDAGSHIRVEPPRGILAETNGPRGDDGDDIDDGEDTRDADGASSQSSGGEEEGDDYSEEDESEEEDDEDDKDDGLQSDSEGDNEGPHTFLQPTKKSNNPKRVSENYRGVYLDTKKQVFAVRVRNKNEDSWLSQTFENEKDAAKAYDSECKRRGWGDAILNFIDGQPNPLAKPRPGTRGKAPRPRVIGGTAKGKARATSKATGGGEAGASAEGRKKAARTAMYRGVTRNLKSPKVKWNARLNLPGAREHLGCFDSEVDAARAYDRAATKRWGDKATLNFHPDGTLNQDRHRPQRGLSVFDAVCSKDRPESRSSEDNGEEGQGEGSGEESDSDMSTVAPPVVPQDKPSARNPGRHDRTSKYRGVTKEKKNNKFIVRLNIGKSSIYLGSYFDELEAARAYDTAAKEQLGDQAILNFLPNGELNPDRGKTLRRASLTGTPPGLVGRGSPRDTDRGVGQKGARRGSEEEGDDEEEEEDDEEEEEDDDVEDEGITVLSVDPDDASVNLNDEGRGLDDDEEESQEDDAMQEDGEARESLPYKGVTQVALNRYRASYYIRGTRKTVVIGRFNTPEEAAKAYDDYVVEHVGQEAVRNFLADGAINPDRMKAFRSARRPREEISSTDQNRGKADGDKEGLPRGDRPAGHGPAKRRRIEPEGEGKEEGWKIGVKQAVRLLKAETFRRVPEEETTPEGHSYQRLWATLEQMDSSDDTSAYTARLLRFLRTNVCPSFDADTLTGKPKYMSHVINNAAWVLAELEKSGKAKGQ